MHWHHGHAPEAGLSGRSLGEGEGRLPEHHLSRLAFVMALLVRVAPGIASLGFESCSCKAIPENAVHSSSAQMQQRIRDGDWRCLGRDLASTHVLTSLKCVQCGGQP